MIVDNEDIVDIDLDIGHIFSLAVRENYMSQHKADLFRTEIIDLIKKSRCSN